MSNRNDSNVKGQDKNQDEVISLTQDELSNMILSACEQATSKVISEFGDTLRKEIKEELSEDMKEEMKILLREEFKKQEESEVGEVKETEPSEEESSDAKTKSIPESTKGPRFTKETYTRIGWICGAVGLVVGLGYGFSRINKEKEGDGGLSEHSPKTGSIGTLSAGFEQPDTQRAA